MFTQPLAAKPDGGLWFERVALEAFGASHTRSRCCSRSLGRCLCAPEGLRCDRERVRTSPSRVAGSFKVSIEEMQSLSLIGEVRSATGDEIELRETDQDAFRAAGELGIDLNRWELDGID
jgi:DNA-directed RNA polymerase subunit beta